MLLSPQFLYRVERGVAVAGRDYARLSHWEMASRLSYPCSGAPCPTSRCCRRPRPASWGTREEIAAQAKRLIDDPRAAEMVTDFASQWLRLTELPDAEKDAAVYPKYSPSCSGCSRGDARRSSRRSGRATRKLNTLLTAAYTMLNAKLAAFYGVQRRDRGRLPEGRRGHEPSGWVC